jgi:enoyl-CoA hydratase/carnithine racemase
MFQDIEYQVSERIAVITINRPKVLNAIRVQTYKDIIAALQSAEADRDVSVIVMTGAEGKFTAGNDLRDLLPEGDLEGVRDGVAGIFDTLASMKKPLIMAQEGVAVGIGANLLLHADLAYAGKSIRYSLPFAKIGVASEGGSSVMLAEAIGPKNAADLLLTGRFFSAAEAEKWGLLNAAVEDGKALETAMAVATDLLKNHQGSIKAIKALGRGEDHRKRVNQAVLAEMDAFVALLATPETQMRIQHVLKGGK